MTQPPGPQQPFDPQQPPSGQSQFGQPAIPPTSPGYGQQPPVGQPSSDPQQQAYGQPQWGQPAYGQQAGVGQQAVHVQQQWGQQQPAQQQPAQQQWGQQQWAPQQPAKGGNGKIIGLLAGGVALVAALGITLWLVLSGGGRSAEDTVDAWLTAAKSNDPSSARDVSCPAMHEELSGPGGMPRDLMYQITDVHEADETATVLVDVTAQGQSGTFEFQLTKNDDGDFEVCHVEVVE